MTPIAPIGSSPFPVAYSSSRAEKPPESPASDVIDVITVSSEGREKLKAEVANYNMLREANKKADSDKAVWRLSSGLKEGTFNLKNGNVQKISLDGGSLSLEEFKNGKLVKSVTGTLSESGAVLDTEYYDSSGRISQSIHTELAKGESKGGWTTASMTRDVKWYDGGKLKGEMQDGMLLETLNSKKFNDNGVAVFLKSILDKGTAAVETDVKKMASMLTTERHSLEYFVQAKEYGDSGQLLRDLSIQQDGDYTQLSNRTSKKIAGVVEGRTTRESKRDTGLKIELKEYDAEGELMREARFSDEEAIKEGKLTLSAARVQRQDVDVAWYDDGELVKRSHGSMELEATKDALLPDRPGFLEVLGLNNEEYLGDKPQSAMELLSKKAMTSSAEADFFLGGVADHINDKDYSYANKLAKYGEGKRPYSVSWTDEVYREGELVLRQADTAKARKSSFYQQERGILFRKGGALTENDSPALLRESNHEREVYENGRLVAHQAMEARERVDVDHNGPDTLKTHAVYRNGVAGNEDTTVIDGEGGIMQYDAMYKSAAKGLSTGIETTLDATYNAITHLNRGDEDKVLDYRVHPHFGG